MAFRSRFRSRRAQAMSIRFKRRMLFRQPRSRASGTIDGIRFFKLTRMVPMVNAEGGLAVTDNPNQAPDFSNLVNLFGFYRVNAIRIRYIPRANVNQTAATLTAEFSRVLIVHDWDTTGVMTESQMLQHENLVVRDPFRSFQYFRRMRRQVTIAGSPIRSTDGYFQTGSPVETQRILLNAFGNAGTTCGNLVITYFIACKQRV